MQKQTVQKLLAGLLAAGWSVASALAAAPATPQGFATVREYRDIGGVNISDLLASPKYPNAPDFTDYPTYFEWPQTGDINTNPPGDVRNNYGWQIDGYFYPPVTGNYVFIIAADDGADLYLSTDDTAANAKRIATEPVWNPVRAFDGATRRNEAAPENNSSTYNASEWPTGNTITLTANRPYYIRARAKEAGGGDNLAVAVIAPDGSIDPTQPIPGRYLSSSDRASTALPFFGGASAFAGGFDVTVTDGTGAGATTAASATAKLNGADVTVSVVPFGAAKSVRYRAAAGSYLPAGAHTIEVSLRDSAGAVQTQTFAVNVAAYQTVPAAMKTATPATARGLTATVKQMEVPRSPGDRNSIANGEQQLADGFINPDTGAPYVNLSALPVSEVTTVNWEQTGFDIGGTPENGPDWFNSARPASAPIPNDFIPGIPGALGTDDNIAAAVTGFLRLNAGVYRMGVNSDDGFTVTVGGGPRDLLLGSFNGGRGAADTVFDFVVTESGDYPFRLSWWEGVGGANVEWWTQNIDTGVRNLVNGPGGVEAYRTGSARAYLSSLLPANGFTGTPPRPTIRAVLTDGSTQVATASVVLKIDGQTVTANVSKSGANTTVTYTPSADYARGSAHTLELTFNDGTERTYTSAFTIQPPTFSLLVEAAKAATGRNHFVIEVEDFNYDGGKHNPMVGVPGKDVNVMPYTGGAYDQLGAIEGIDYNNDDGNDSDQYRTELDANGQNEINIASDTGNNLGNGNSGSIPVRQIDRGTWEMESNWKIGWIGGGNWQNYTRTIPAGWYNVWVASSYDGGTGTINHTLALVTSDPTQPNQTTEVLGSFNGNGTGGWSLNNLFPMRTATGDLAAIRTTGQSQTFRLNNSSGDTDFIVFVPALAPPPSIVSVPQDDARRDAAVFTWTLGDSDTVVNVSSVKLKLNGTEVPSSKLTVTKTGSGATVVYDNTGNLSEAGEHTWELSFADTAPTPRTVTGSGTFIINPYPTPGTFVIEAEDFNYDGGKTNPQAGVAGKDVNVMPYLGGAYAGLGALLGIDFNGNDGNDSDLYRTEKDSGGENAVNIAESLGGRFGADRGTYNVESNWRLGWVGGGEWQNYTRTIPNGNYQVWAALSYDGRGANNLRAFLDLVTSDPAVTGQTTTRLGSFNGAATGGWGRNELVPMKNAQGAIATLPFGGTQTLRFFSESGDFDYFLLVPTGPVVDPGAPRVSATLAGGNVTVTWTGGGTLESGPSVTGPWTSTGDSDGSFSKAATAAQEYFRVRR